MSRRRLKSRIKNKQSILKEIKLAELYKMRFVDKDISLKKIDTLKSGSGIVVVKKSQLPSVKDAVSKRKPRKEKLRKPKKGYKRIFKVLKNSGTDDTGPGIKVRDLI